MFGIRVLKRRWVLGVIFGCSLLYFILNIQKQYPTLGVDSPTAETEKPKPKIHPDSIEWNAKEDNKSSHLITCRNSVQGKLLIADDQGVVCRREDILAGGCCDTKQPGSSQRFDCTSCESTGCCEVYEYCVSCCLQPEKQPLLRKILGRISDQLQSIFASVTDQFELCLTKCRTSSQSVQHENSYRDSKAKYCYGENPPDLQPLAA